MLFLDMRNGEFKETVLLDDLLKMFRKVLPDGWNVTFSHSGVSGIFEPDGFLKIRNSSGEEAEFVAYISSSVSSPALVISRLREMASRIVVPAIYISEYVGPTMRRSLAEEGFGFLDPTGWIRLVGERPMLFILSEGAKKSPRPVTAKSVTRLNGVAVNRVLRALCEVELPVRVRELATESKASPGSVSKILPTLVQEGALERNEDGAVVSVRARTLLARWTQAYSFQKSNEGIGYFLAPRGIESALSRLESGSFKVTLTGSLAAKRLLPVDTVSVAPSRLLAGYTKDVKATAKELRLVEVEPHLANVMLAVPQDFKVLEMRQAPIGLLLADLLTLPGRGDAEALQVMDYLAMSDDRWEN